MRDHDWTPTEKALPPRNKVVLTMDSGGHVQTLVFADGMWWFPDKSMYVYYVPLFWKLEDSQ